MGILDTLVVGVDDSTSSRVAVSWAAERVPPGGTLHLVHAMAEERAGWRSAESCETSARRQELERLLAGEWRHPAAGCEGRVETHLVTGDPTDELLKLAGRLEADAIVVGPHSKPHNLGTLGHVTRRLLQRVSAPIVVAKGATGPRPSDDGEPRPVVACVGYGEATEAAARWAADYAADRHRPLTLLHVVGYRPLFPADSPSDMLASYLGGDVLRRWAEEDLDDLQHRIEVEHADLVTSTTVEEGFASRVIVAGSGDAELIVLGKRQDSAAIRSFISPRIHQLIVKSATSVAVVPRCSTET